MKLIAYQVVDYAPRLLAAGHRRGWMDDTPDRYSYFCVPLVMASRAGWELINPVAFTAFWDGTPGAEGVTILPAGGGAHPLVSSHFGSGILTFTTGYLFRTEPGHNLLVRGTPNQLKDGVAALEGMVETDWLPYTFTMNWRFTRAHHTVTFEAGEPFCFLAPQPRHYVESVEPALESIAADPETERQYRGWMETRERFDRNRAVPGTEEARQRWRKDYMQGRTALGDRAPYHQARLTLREFGPPSPTVTPWVRPSDEGA